MSSTYRESNIDLQARSLVTILTELLHTHNVHRFAFVQENILKINYVSQRDSPTTAQLFLLSEERRTQRLCR